MQIKEGMEDAYRQAHRRVWPELIAAGQRVGIRNYTIFTRDQDVYSYLEVEDLGQTLARLAADPIYQKWQVAMVPFMESGHSVEYLEEVFHMD